MATKLNADEIQARLSGVPGWTQDGDRIQREFKFQNFREAFAFMTACALAAEKMDHHPEWSNVYNRVRVALSTHDAGGITEKDFELAAAMNAAAGR